MSGGSYDYAYAKVSDMAENMRHLDRPERRKFRDLLLRVAKAMEAVEWEDSGDTSREATTKAIDEVLGGSK